MTGENIAGLFSRIAGYYDMMNSLFSLNRDRYWRRRAGERTRLGIGGTVLDVCCGTGLFTLELARLTGPTGRVTGLDFCPEMLAVAQRRLAQSPLQAAVSLVTGDALALPFATGEFPVVTSAFGLRNLPDFTGGLAEMIRVTAGGGRIVILELGKPQGKVWEVLYGFYLNTLLPRLGKAATGTGQSYCWLPESLRRFPERQVLCQMMADHGLEKVECIPLTGGIANVFTATKP